MKLFDLMKKVAKQEGVFINFPFGITFNSDGSVFYDPPGRGTIEIREEGDLPGKVKDLFLTEVTVVKPLKSPW